MLKKFVYGAICVLFAVVGILLVSTFLRPWLEAQHPNILLPALVGSALVMAAIGALLAPKLVRGVENVTEKSVTRVSALSMQEIFSCAIGLIAGLVIASLIGSAVARIQVIGTYLAIIAVLLFGYIGLIVGYRKRDDFIQFFANLGKGEKAEKSEKADRKEKATGKITPKILDTSVIIDGRIADIYRSGFLEGNLIVPNFVLEELRHIADSGDMLKRNRGRSGLDILNKMREEYADSIIIVPKDYPDIAEVDSKLLKLTQDMKGVIVTNDFNLNKVAQLQGIRVLNINELSNAVKPIVLPGEEMIAHMIKEGKEQGQGIAYLDDGTMIVVENGKRYVGRYIYVVVTSILQTAAGRMVFARPKYGKSGDVVEAGDREAI